MRNDRDEQNATRAETLGAVTRFLSNVMIMGKWMGEGGGIAYIALLKFPTRILNVHDAFSHFPPGLCHNCAWC